MSDWRLAIETSSRRGSIALGRDGRAAAERVLQTDRTHTAELLPAVRDLLAECGVSPADVGVIAFSQGPGSFTGLRVAATLARTWQSAAGCKVVGVVSTDAIARAAWLAAARPVRLVVVVDARQGRVFGAEYVAHDAGYERVVGPDAHDAAWIATLEPSTAVTGDGVPAIRAAAEVRGLAIVDEALWLPRATDVLALGGELVDRGRFLQPHEIVPLYIRRPECEEVYEQRRAAAIARRTGEQ